MTAAATGWNSLEIVKLVVSALTPIFVLVLTLVVARRTKEAEARDARAERRAENAEWVNRRAVERLIVLHEQMAPLMNDLLCFFAWVGHFREINPQTAVDTKRKLDKLYFVNEHLFTDEFRSRYRAFIEECFVPSPRAGEDAKLRTSRTTLQRERGPSAPDGWKEEWDRLFAVEPTNAREMRGVQMARYNAAMGAFASMLGLSRRPTDD